jgi:hypothetical protein
MTGPEHYREAERLIEQADTWMDADHGWRGELSTEERLSRRAADLAAAQVHATLALAASNALLGPFSAACLKDDIEADALTAWYETAGVAEQAEGAAR